MNKPTLRYPVIVEGKYDKIKLDSLFNGQILPLDGFRIFKNAEKKAFFRRLAEKTPLIVLTDPDGGGKVLRRFLSRGPPPDRVFHLHIPKQKGKEARKAAPSKEGFLGVEGMDAALLRACFAPYLLPPDGESGDAPTVPPPLSCEEMFALGLSGVPDAAERRAALCLAAGLPADLTAPALRRALPLLFTADELRALLSRSET